MGSSVPTGQDARESSEMGNDKIQAIFTEDGSGHGVQEIKVRGHCVVICK